MAEQEHTKTTLHPEQLAEIRQALLVGLAALGEIERLSAHAALMERTGELLPRELRPIHPTCDAATVSQFASALRSVEMLAA